MFTGIVEKLGRVVRIEPKGEAQRLTFHGGEILEGAGLGDSIAVNGVCLTVVALEHGEFTVDAVEETMRRTNLGRLAPGDPVNLERPLRPVDRMGGHFVQGHIDGTAAVSDIRPEAESWMVTFSCAADVSRHLVEKGSVALDGVSLTVVSASDGLFQVALIPHTLQVTNMGSLQPGTIVNVEVDILSKYVFKALESLSTTKWSLQP